MTLRHLGYVELPANLKPGGFDVFDTERMKRIEVVTIEKGAHTIALNVERNKVYASLPQTCRAAVYVDEG